MFFEKFWEIRYKFTLTMDQKTATCGTDLEAEKREKQDMSYKKCLGLQTHIQAKNAFFSPLVYNILLYRQNLVWSTTT